jgi:glutamyl-tRNA synthetase
VTAFDSATSTNKEPHRLREMRGLVARDGRHRFDPSRKPFAGPSREQFHRVVGGLHFEERMVRQKRNRIRKHGFAPFEGRPGMQRQAIHKSTLSRGEYPPLLSCNFMLRVRFAPSPTGYLHIGSARTFIFNWLYARRNGGSMILRIDDTDLERNTEVSLNSIFEGLRWLDLGWDEQYRQSERLDLHKQLAEAILAKGMAYRDFTPASGEDSEKSQAVGAWLSNPGQRETSREESDRRACAGEPFVLRYRVPRENIEDVTFTDSVYGEQRKSTADIEDFALARSNGAPTYHLASCADDIDLRISHIVRGQDHLTNTFKHVLIFRAAGVEPPKFAHLPLLVAPDGAKLSKRKHGPVVSVTTYRDAGFLPHAFINFLCLLGWSPKDDREAMTREELLEVFSFEGVNRSNAVVNFSDDDPFDAKAVWLNAEHIRRMKPEDLAAQLRPIIEGAGYSAEKLPAITPLIQERIRLLRDALTVGDFFFKENLAPYDTAELIPKKGDADMALRALLRARETLTCAGFTHDGLEHALRGAAEALGIKAGQMFEPIRVAVCGRKTAPPLFGTLEVLGRETSIKRIGQAIEKLESQ